MKIDNSIDFEKDISIKIDLLKDSFTKYFENIGILEINEQNIDNINNFDEWLDKLTWLYNKLEKTTDYIWWLVSEMKDMDKEFSSYQRILKQSKQ